MSPYRRNIIVGVTVLLALGFLGWMILKFGGSVGSLFTPPSMPITFRATRADGVGDGSPILYQGVTVGRVTLISRDPNMRDVTIDSMVDIAPPLPANVRGEIRAQSLLGSGSAINLAVTGPQPQGTLQAGAVIDAEYLGLDLLPPEFAEVADELGKTAQQLRDSNLIANLNRQVTKAGELMDSVHSLVADEQMRSDLKDALSNIKSATESATRISANLEKFTGDLDKLSSEASGTLGDVRATVTKTDQRIQGLSEQVSARLEQTSKLLDSFQSITSKIDSGKGTAGQLVNDPRLYESLVDTSRELNATVADLRRLVEQWEQEGVSLKLKR